MPVGGSDFGTLPPAGTALDLSSRWIDGTYAFRSGSTLTVSPTATVSLPGNASVGAVAINDVTTSVTPTAAGLIGWDFPYALATQGAASTGSAVTVGGTLYLAQINLSAGTVISNIWFRIATAASGITTAQNFAGIYNSAGALVATTADLASTIGTNTGPIQGALTSAYTVPTSGRYYVGVFFNAGTTLPVLGVYANQQTVTTGAQNLGSLTTFGNTAATFPFAVNTTGNTTALPASLTLSSNSATGAYAYWVAVD